MNLLKIGNLDIQPEKWQDAYSIFNEIFFVGMKQTIKPLPNMKLVDLKLNKVTYMLYLIQSWSNKFKFLNFISIFCIKILRVYYKKTLLDIASLNYDEVLVSYSDFDYSSFIFYLIFPFLKKVRITRAYKETRSQYSFLEMKSFQLSDRIVLNSFYNKLFFEKKYCGIFNDKELILDIDEDYRKSDTQKSIKYASKLSDSDQRIHAVILAGRVLSNKNDKRSGSRLYYIDLIKKLLMCGFVVHLQAKIIVPYKNRNPYEELSNSNSDFIIENNINFSGDKLRSYYELSKYDIGIMHAHIKNESSYYFDKVNLPHRYYEYQLAHVVPIDIKGENLLVDEKAEKKHALVVNDFAEITFDKLKVVEWEYPTFKDYIRSMYPN